MKPKVSLLVAVDEKNGIGKDNKIPWHLRNDLIRLKKLTLGNVVILGRNTYESMAWYYDKSGRQMPGRLYIVVSRNPGCKPARENTVLATSLESALAKAQENEKNAVPAGKQEVFIMGGAQIFSQAIEKGIVDRIYLTRVEGDFGCDTFFPVYTEFTKVLNEEEGEENGIKYKYLDLEK